MLDCDADAEPEKYCCDKPSFSECAAFGERRSRTKEDQKI